MMYDFKTSVLDTTMTPQMGVVVAPPGVQISDDGVDDGSDDVKLAAYNCLTGHATDKCRLRSPTYSWETRLIVAANLASYGSAKFVGQPVNIYDEKYGGSDPNEVKVDGCDKMYGLMFGQRDADIYAVGIHDYQAECSEIRLKGGMRMLAEPFIRGRQRTSALIDTKAFHWISERLWHLAKRVETEAGIWGESKDTEWCEFQCIHLTEGDVIEKHEVMRQYEQSVAQQEKGEAQ